MVEMSARSLRVPTSYQRFAARYSDFTAELAVLRKARDRALRQISTSGPRVQRDLVRRILRRHDLHILYAYDGVRRSGQLRQHSPETIRGLAASFNAFAAVERERVTLNVVDKGNGRRTVQNFGPRRRMHQALVADLLRALHSLPRTQFMFAGGIPAALAAVATANRDGGCTHGVEADFVGFYRSVQFNDALVDLMRPLPASVVENVVWDTEMRTPSGVMQSLCASEPASSDLQGLSLGAATSPIVGELIIARLLAAAQLSNTITYADNLFVLGRSDEEVTARIQRLRDILACQTYGSLELRVRREAPFLLNHFEFAGHAGQNTSEGIRWAPGDRKLAQFEVSEVNQLSLEEIELAERRVSHWRRAYPQWDDGDVREAEYLAALSVRRYYLQADVVHLRKAVHAIVVAHAARVRVEPDFDGGLYWFITEAGDRSGNGRARLEHELAAWFSDPRACDRPHAQSASAISEAKGCVKVLRL